MIKENIIEEMIRRSFRDSLGDLGQIDITYCKLKDYDDDLGAIGEHIECKFSLPTMCCHPIQGISSPKTFHCFIRTDMYEFNVKKQKEIIFV